MKIKRFSLGGRDGIEYEVRLPGYTWVDDKIERVFDERFKKKDYFIVRRKGGTYLVGYLWRKYKTPEKKIQGIIDEVKRSLDRYKAKNK